MMNVRINEDKKNIERIIDIKKFGFRSPIIPKNGLNGAMIMDII